MTEPEFNHERTRCLFCSEWVELDTQDSMLLNQENPYVRQFGMTHSIVHKSCFDEMPEDPQRAEEEGWTFDYDIWGNNNADARAVIPDTSTLTLGGNTDTSGDPFNLTVESNTANINVATLNMNTSTINVPVNSTVNLGEALYFTAGNHVTSVSGTSSYTGNFHVNINGDAPDNRFLAFHASTVKWNDLLFVIGRHEIGIHLNDERIAIFTRDEIQGAINSFTQKPKGIKGKIKRFFQKLILKLFI